MISEASPSFLYWFAYYGLDSPSVRYRAYYPLQFLKKHHNVGSVLVVPGYRPRTIFAFVCAYVSAFLFPKANSLVVIQRVHSHWIYSNLLKLLVRLGRSRTLYDLDDADYLEHPGKNIFYFMRHCHAVSVGSEALRQVALRYNSRVVLNTSPTVDLGLVKKGRGPVLNIGWVGCFGGGHKESLVQFFFPALKTLSFPVKLTLLGVNKPAEREWLSAYFRDFRQVELDLPTDIEWLDEADVQRRIARFDVGIATLLNNELHVSKSAFKLKQYLNNGVPVLSSNFPENRCFVEEGINGFLCATPDDFRQKLTDIQEMSDTEYAALVAGSRSSIHRFGLERYGQTLLAHF